MNNHWTLYRHLLGLILLVALVGCQDTSSNTEEEITAQPNSEKEELETNVYVIPGDYYEMFLGKNEDRITGVFFTKEGNENECFFFFEGKIGSSNPVKVECYNPLSTDPPINGKFKILGKELFLKLHQKPMKTCISQLADEVGYPLILDLEHKWKAIRVIERETPVFEDSMEGLEVGNRIPKGTVVAVKEFQGDWLRVDVPEYKYKNGWIKKDFLFPLLEI